MTRLRIGTRASALARWQANAAARAIQARYPTVSVEIVELNTPGDEQPNAPLERMEGYGWFTSTLERALTERRIDLAVHSYKDLPVVATQGLTVAAALPRGPVEDVLCARNGARLVSLPAGARVGTSSLRRLAQLRRLRPELAYRPVRGNVPTRLERVAAGDLDAVVLARAGLERLGLLGHATEVFPVVRMLPAPAQGGLALQTRADDPGTVALIGSLDHRPSHRAIEAERTVLRALRGGCSVPVGAVARETDGQLLLRAAVFSCDGAEALDVYLEGDDPVALGEAAARRLVTLGARRLLSDALHETALQEVAP